MKGQMTIFDYLNSWMFDFENELLRELPRGGNVEGGKRRIKAMYAIAVSPVERQKMLAKEYGIGGHSVVFEDGSRGFVDYNGKGITISRYEEKKTFPWGVVEKRIGELIKSGGYQI